MHLGPGRTNGAALTVGAAAVGLVFVSTATSQNSSALTIAGVVFVAGVLAARSRPHTAISVALIMTTLQLPVLSALYSHGAPAAMVRGLGFVKEGVIVGLLLAILTDDSRSRRTLTRPDILGLAFVAWCLVYLLAPFALAGAFGSSPFATRLAAFRLNVLFVVLILAARQLPWSQEQRFTLRRTLVVLGLSLSVGALYETFDNGGWLQLANTTLNVPRYRQDILGSGGGSAITTTFTGLGGSGVQRDGSWLYDCLNLGFVSIVPLAAALAAAFRERRWWPAAAAALLIGATLALTVTRSAVLAGLVAALLLVLAAGSPARRGGRGRAVLVVSAAVAGVALLGGANLTHRVEGASNGRDASAGLHASATATALADLRDMPMGRGLGSNPVTANLDATGTGVTAENAYLQVGDELGVPAMLLFVGFLLSLLVELADRAKVDASHLAAAAWAGGWGLFINGFFLHVWLSFPASLAFGAAAAAATASTVLPATSSADASTPSVAALEVDAT